MNRSKDRVQYSAGQLVFVRDWPAHEVARILEVRNVNGWPAYLVVDQHGGTWHIAQLFLGTIGLKRYGR